MKKIAYLECPTGIAGDMCLGALVHAGVPLDYLRSQLAKLGISHEYHLWAEQIYHNGQLATKVHVDLLLDETLDHHHTQNIPGDRPLEPQSKSDLPLPDSSRPNHDHQHQDTSHNHDSDHHRHQDLGHSNPDHDHGNHNRHRHLPEITQLITQADLPIRVKDWSLAVFRSLAEAEGVVHGVPADQVHFHEVGATDAIVDIVGTCLGLDWLGIEALYCSALPTGGGTIWAAHGRLPVPVPAVLQLWQSRHCPIYSNGIDKELVTPTGAALAVTLAQDFGQPPAMNLHKVGLGAGTQPLPIPNILRLWLGEKIESFTAKSNAVEVAKTEIIETIAVLETQIDDLSPQAISYTCDRLFRVGAVDVFTQGITMKKSRLGTLLTVIAPMAKIAECEAVLFQETSTLGIRRSIQERAILQREIQSVQTSYGTVRVKVAWQEGESISNVQPEYEDCAAIAKATNLPWRQVQAAALQNWHNLSTDSLDTKHQS